jgi:hypothetical protein
MQSLQGRRQRRVNLSPEGVAGERLVDHQTALQKSGIVQVSVLLERVSPVQKHVDPVAANAGAASAGVDFIRTADAEIVSRLISVRSKIRCIVPENVHAHAHAWCDKIPEVPFAQQNAVRWNRLSSELPPESTTSAQGIPFAPLQSTPIPTRSK